MRTKLVLIFVLIPFILFSQAFNCDGKIYFFRTVGDSTYIAYIDNYITSTPVVENVCNLTAMGVANQNALAANPYDGHLYFMTLNNYNLFKIDASCNRTLVCHSVANSHRGCFDNLGRYWVIVGSDLEAFDITSCTVVKGPYPLALTPGADIAFSLADCHLYMSSESGLIKIDTNGNIVYSNNVGFGTGTGYGGIGIGVDGHLYGIPNIYDTIILNKIDLNTLMPAGVSAAFSTSVANPCGCDMATFPCSVLHAEFTASPMQACQPVDVQFTNLSSGLVNNWLWDFGDGTLDSVHVDPQHTYTDTGTYTVTLIVYAYSTCMYIAPDTFSLDIEVYQTPVADFYFGNACEDAFIPFTDSSSGINIVDWQWDFGDGQFSSAQNPEHIYQNYGDYDVQLMVENSFGCADSIIKTITVHPKPHADFVSQSMCDGVGIPFNDNSTVSQGDNIQSWVWAYGDGNYGTGSTNQYIYDTSGTYTVQLIVETNHFCKDTTAEDVRVYARPVAAFSYNDICESTVALFANNSSIAATDTILTFDWDFGNGSAGVQGLTNVQCMYNQAGIYDVKLVAVSTQNCMDSLIQQITVYDAPDVAFQTNAVCIYDSAIFTNSTQNPLYGSIGGWFWNFGDNTSSDSLNWHTSHLYTQAGIYDVSLTVYNAVLNCADTFTATLEIYPAPIAEFSSFNACFNEPVSFTNLSQGNIDNYLWDFGDGNTALNEINPEHIYDSDGSYNVWLVVTTVDGCVDSVRHDVITHPLPIADFNFTNVCFGFNNTFTDISTVLSPDYIVNWQWDFGDGSAPQQNQNPVHLYPQSGLYTVQLIANTNNSCTDTIEHTITVYPLAVADFSADTLGCTLFCTSFNDLTLVSSGLITQWLWTFGNGSNSTSQSPLYCYENNSLVPVKYSITLTVMTDASCVSSITKPDYITVLPKPVADFTLHPEKTNLLEPLISFYDQSQQAISWVWDFGDNSVTDNSQNPVHSYQDTGIFFIALIVQNIYGCFDTANAMVYIEPDWALYIPNAFTPNGDGLNDNFFVKGYGIVEFEMLIFSRWGQMVFYADDMEKMWDGRVLGRNSGEIAMQGVYAYRINFKTVTHRKLTRYGHVVLLRGGEE